MIEQIGENIIWRDFGYENNYEDEVVYDEYENITPIIFDKAEYENTIRGALLASAQSNNSFNRSGN